MGQFVFDGPAADLGAVEFEGVAAQRFGGGEAVGTRGLAGQALMQQRQHGLRPGLGMIAPGSAGRPKVGLLLGAGAQVSGGQRVQAAAREAELLGGLRGGQRAQAKTFQDVTDEGGRVAMEQLVVFFKGQSLGAPRLPTASLFVGHRYARPPQRLAVGRKDLQYKLTLSGFAISQTCPVLLAPRHKNLETSRPKAPKLTRLPAWINPAAHEK